MRLLVDGVFYQLATTGIARVWTSLLCRLAKVDGLEVLMLNRGRCPAIDGIDLVDFPSHTSTYTASDSLLIQDFCDRHSIDVFTSTYYTTPISTPQVLMVYDMIPEVLGFSLSDRIWQEKRLALHYASRLACISASTRKDLHKVYPDLDLSRSVIAHCGVDSEVFNDQAAHGLPALRERYGLNRPYVIIVGSRKQHLNYKNAKLFFDAIAIDKSADMDILCIGGEPEIEPDWLRSLPEWVHAIRLDLSDAELASAYSGAIALIYPSLYEGFGMPVVEAMASGCPVITTEHGSLEEVAGGAALMVSGRDRYELLAAFHRVQEPEQRTKLIRAGLERASHFDWNRTAEIVLKLLHEAYEERFDPGIIEFHRRWKKLRRTQADVDVGLD